ncbi:hypothetical protein FOZ63_010527, partial [Perkinsus olseni]
LSSSILVMPPHKRFYSVRVVRSERRLKISEHEDSLVDVSKLGSGFAVSLLVSTVAFGGQSPGIVASQSGGMDTCSMACNQTMGCDQSYCKNNGMCFGLYHKGNAFCYQPGGADGCDDASLEPVKCTDYPLTTCQDVCDRLVGCKDSAWGSYCKSWQDPPICFGILKMYDGSLCHQSDPNCTGEPFECHFAVGPVQPTVPNKPSTMPLLP